MKIDVVIDFYQKWQHWYKVAAGLRQNSAHINRVILVSDNPWSSEEEATLRGEDLDAPLLLRWHDHLGYGGARCTNEGLALVETDYWLALNADVMLLPGVFENILSLMTPQSIVYPIVHDVDGTLSLEALLDHPPILLHDGLEKFTGHPWRYFRDYCACEHTASSRALGGRAIFPGWGCSDHDYGCRWALTFGLEHIMHLGGPVYNLGVADTHHELLPETKQAWVRTRDQFVARYGGL
jgi:hypothetical protein